MNVKISPYAQNDLIDIFHYIKEILKNPIAAEHTKNGIVSEINKLSNSPFIGSPAIFHTVKIAGFYTMRYKNFNIFYRIAENDVLVERICYSRRDFDKLFP